MQNLITDHLDIWTAAHKTRSTAGRGSSNKLDLYGIKKLREFILELAVRGKLVPQDPNDEPASELLKKIAVEKEKLIKEGKIKREKPLPEITDEEKPFELPDRWKWIRLNEIGYTQTGGTPSKSNSNFYGTDIPFIKPGDIYSNYIDYQNEGLSFEGAENLNRVAPKCSILMVCIGTIGKRGLIDKECAFNQQINSITPFIKVEQFLYHAMGANFFQQEAWDRSSSTTIAILNKGNWETILVPLPPLAEQHRIVAKVDELMAFCDQLEQTQSDNIAAHAQLVEALLASLTNSTDHNELQTNWQRIAAHFDTLFTTGHSIDQLKQTILQLAVMGKLVPQNPNDEPASVLLKKIAAEKAQLIKEGKIKKEKPLPEIAEEEKPFELPEGWEWVRLLDISAYVHYGYTAPSDSNIQDVRLLRITDIQDNKVDWSTVPGCEIKRDLIPQYELINEDILIARTGGTIGKSYLVENINVCAVFASYLIRVKHIKNTSSAYKKVYLGSLLYWNQLYANSMGTGQPNVNGEALKNLVVPLPPINEQHRIVAKVDELMSLCDTLKTNLQNAQTTQLALADALVEQALG